MVEPDAENLVRTTVLITTQTNEALRGFAAEAERPFSWEVRRALEEYVERHAQSTKED